MLRARGIVVTYEAIRKWWRKFGQVYANQLRRHRPQPGDKWHLDEVFLRINDERHYLWRAMDQDDPVGRPWRPRRGPWAWVGIYARVECGPGWEILGALISSSPLAEQAMKGKGVQRNQRIS
jgi:hypothetical protein